MIKALAFLVALFGVQAARAATPPAAVYLGDSFQSCTRTYTVGGAATCTGAPATIDMGLAANATLTAKSGTGTATVAGAGTSGFEVIASNGTLRGQLDVTNGLCIYAANGNTYCFDPTAGALTVGSFFIGTQQLAVFPNTTVPGGVLSTQCGINQWVVGYAPAGGTTPGAPVCLQPTIAMISGAGTAAGMNASASSGSTIVASVIGTPTQGHMATFGDGKGSVGDGGTAPTPVSPTDPYALTTSTHYIADMGFVGYAVATGAGVQPTLNAIYYEPLAIPCDSGYAHVSVNGYAVRDTAVATSGETASFALYTVAGRTGGTAGFFTPTAKIAGSEVDGVALTGSGNNGGSITALAIACTNQMLYVDVAFAYTGNAGTTHALLTMHPANTSLLSSVLPQNGVAPLGGSPPTGMVDSTTFSSALPATPGTISLTTTAIVPAIEVSAKIAP